VCERRAYAFRDFQGRGRWNTGQEGYELFSTDASDEIERPQRPRQGLGKGNQELVANQVSEAVVDALEMIEMAQQQRKRRIVRLASRNEAFRALAEAAPVGDSGQCVGE